MAQAMELAEKSPSGHRISEAVQKRNNNPVTTTKHGELSSESRAQLTTQRPTEVPPDPKPYCTLKIWRAGVVALMRASVGTALAEHLQCPEPSTMKQRT